MTNQPFGVFTTISAPSPNEWAGERDGDGDEGRRNKKTRILSALLSAGALGVFLEGCGGADPAGGGGGNPAGGSNTLGGENNPFLATADTANTFTGSPGTDWVSYAGSNAGVAIDLRTDSATASGGWADGDTLTGINNLIGSDGDDTFTGNGNANTFRGGDGADIYVFGADGGTNTDILTDDGGNIVFLQGSNNDYAGATYSFVRADGGRGDAVTLTVTKNSNTLNVIEFTNDPSSGYSFSTRSGGGDTAIADTELVVPAKIVGEGSESSPFLATAGVDILTGSGARDWVSYAGSNEGVTIDLRADPATVSGGWADGDTLTGINNLIGSDGVDTFTGNGNANTFRGGAGADTYVFGADGGTNTDILTDDGGNIVFLQGTNDDYAGATYSFVRADGGRSDAVTLTVTKNSNTLNVIEFTNDPSSGYSFSTRSSGVDTAIADTELVVPAKIVGEGSESSPFLATAGVDILTGSGARDWVSYAGSNEGVTIDLRADPATVSGGWAAGDSLTAINNLIGSDGVDTFTGNGNANTFRGGAGADTYVFGADGGTNTDILTDDGGNIVFLQGTNDDYAGATYSFVRADGGRSDAVTLTVTKNSNTLNVIEFTNDPSSGYSFSTRSSGVDTAIADTELVVPAKIVGEGSESSPFLATAGVDILTGSGARDWVSYAGSNEGVTIDLRADPATASGGWADGDTLTGINNLIGSPEGDRLKGNSEDNTLYGGGGTDSLEGGEGADTYVFDADGGTNTDILTDDGGNIVFLQGSNNDYAGATYSFVRADGGRGDAVTLTVTKNSNTLNVIEFTNDPSSGYSFSTRSSGVDTAIDGARLVVPAKIVGEGSESSPFLATTSADAFTGSPGADWVSYEASTLFVAADLGSLAQGATPPIGGAFGDTFTGINNIIGVQDKINHLSGNNNDNTLRGGNQNDHLQGRGGADTLEGGEGTDTVLYGSSTKGVRVDLSLQQGQAQADFETNTYGFTANNNDAVGDILTGIENIEGSNVFDDWLTGNDEANSFDGGGGDDRLEGRGGEDTYHFSGRDGTDTVVDDGGVIYFPNSKYGGYTYTVSTDNTLTIRGDGFLQNTIKFTIDPSAYTFSYRNDQGVTTAIDYNTFTTPDS